MMFQIFLRQSAVNGQPISTLTSKALFPTLRVTAFQTFCSSVSKKKEWFDFSDLAFHFSYACDSICI